MVSNTELYDLFAKDPAACFTDLKDPTVPSSLEDMVPPPYLINDYYGYASKLYTPNFTDTERLAFFDETDHRRLNSLPVRDIFEGWHFDYIIKTGTKPPLLQVMGTVWVVAHELLEVIKEYGDPNHIEYFPIKVGILTKKGERIAEDADYYIFNMIKHCFTYHPYTSHSGPNESVEFKSKKYNAPLYAGWCYNTASHWHYYDFRSLDVWCIPCSYSNDLIFSDKVLRALKKRKMTKRLSYRQQNWVFPDGTGYDAQKGLWSEEKIKLPDPWRHPLDPRSEASTYYRRYLETYGHIRGFV